MNRAIKWCLTSIICALVISSVGQEQKRPAQDEISIQLEQADFLEGPGYRLSDLEQDVAAYVRGRYAFQRSVFQSIFKTDGNDVRGVQSIESDHNYLILGAEQPALISLHQALNYLTGSYQPKNEHPGYVKAQLLARGLPNSELGKLQDAFGHTWETYRRSKVLPLGEPYQMIDSPSPEQLHQLVRVFRETEWQAGIDWSIWYLERFSPRTRQIVLGYVADSLVDRIREVRNPFEPSPRDLSNMDWVSTSRKTRVDWLPLERPTTRETIPGSAFFSDAGSLLWLSEKLVSFQAKKGFRVDPGLVLESEQRQYVQRQLGRLHQNLVLSAKRRDRHSGDSGCIELPFHSDGVAPNRLELLLPDVVAILVARIEEVKFGYDPANPLALLQLGELDFIRKPRLGSQKKFYLEYKKFKVRIGDVLVCGTQKKYFFSPAKGHRLLILLEHVPRDGSRTLLSVVPNNMFFESEQGTLIAMPELASVNSFMKRRNSFSDFIKIIRSMAEEYPYDKSFIAEWD